MLRVRLPSWTPTGPTLAGTQPHKQSKLPRSASSIDFRAPQPGPGSVGNGVHSVPILQQAVRKACSSRLKSAWIR